MQNTSHLIYDFYRSFSALDAQKMVANYHPDVVFKDPAFGELKGSRARNMWRMLCDSQKGKDFRVKVLSVEADEEFGMALWEARYAFGRSERKVHNKIKAKFKFSDGKIIEHTDHFDLYRWSRQAMGIAGWLIGWSSFFQKSLQKKTNRMLDRFIENAR